MITRPYDLAQQGQGLARHVEVRIQSAAQAFEGDEGLDQQGQVRRQCEVVLAQDGGDVEQHVPQADLGELQPVVLVHEGLDVGFQLVGRDLLPIAGPLQQHIGHGQGLALHQSQQQLEQLLTPAHREMPDHAEVDEGQRIARQVEHIARVRVGVEEAVFHDHLEHGLRAALGQQLAIQARSGELGQFMAGDALHKVLHIDAFARVSPVRARDTDPGQRGHVARQPFGVAAFGGQVQLALQRTAELAQQLARAIGGQRRDFGLGQAVEQAQVGLDHLADAGTADLDDDLGAVLELRAVHLRNRGGGQRLGVEAGQHRFGFATEVLAQLRSQQLEGQGLHVAVQALEFGNPFRPEHVGAARQDLAELDEGGAEFFQRLAQLHGGRQLGQIGGMVPVQTVAGLLEHAGQAPAPHEVAQAVADQHAGDFVESAKVAAPCHLMRGRAHAASIAHAGLRRERAAPGSVRPVAERSHRG